MHRAHLIYFSPTGTTRNISEKIAQELGVQKVIHYDLTLPAAPIETVITDGVAIIGIPVYAGRVPELCLQRMQAVTATGIPAVLVALYGNREFEDALVELRDIAVAKGFKVIAAGAFIGEHSYSTLEQPIAAGRPHAEDLQRAVQFGKEVAAKIEGKNLNPPVIEGHVPYRERVAFGGVAPVTDQEKCTLCGTCAAICPTGVIRLSDSVTTDADHCIMCCACVKGCEAQARLFTHPLIAERRAMLLKNCSVPKAPQLFL